MLAGFGCFVRAHVAQYCDLAVVPWQHLRTEAFHLANRAAALLRAAGHNNDVFMNRIFDIDNMRFDEVLCEPRRAAQHAFRTLLPLLATCRRARGEVGIQLWHFAMAPCRLPSAADLALYQRVLLQQVSSCI